MPKLGPVSRTEVIENLRRLGFSGPWSGAKHQFMIRESVGVRLPNPHGGDLSAGFLLRLLRQAGVSRQEWEAL